MLENNSMLILWGFPLLIAIFLIFVLVAYLMIRPIRKKLPNDLKSIWVEIENLGSRAKNFEYRASSFLDIEKEPYGNSVHVLKSRLATVKQAHNELEDIYKKINDALPTKSRLSALDSLWINLDNQTTELKQKKNACQDKTPALVEIIEELEKLPIRQAGIVTNLQANFIQAGKDFKQLITSTGMHGPAIDELAKLGKQIASEFQKIAVVFFQRQGEGASIAETIQAFEISNQISSLNAAFAGKLETQRLKHQALFENISKLETGLNTKEQLLKDLQSKPLEFEETKTQIHALQIEITKLKGRAHATNTDDLDGLIGEAQDLNQRTSEKVEELKSMVEKHSRFESLHPQIPLKINELRTFLELKPSLVLWNKSQSDLNSIQREFGTLPLPQRQMTAAELGKYLGIAEVLMKRACNLTEACHTSKKQADELFNELSQLRQFFSSQAFLNIRQLARDIQPWDGQDWDDSLNVRTFPMEIDTSYKAFNELLIEKPLNDDAVSAAASQVMDLYKSVTNLKNRAEKIQLTLDDLVKKKNNCKQETAKIIEILNNDLLPLLKTPENSALADAKQLLAEKEKLAALFQLLDEKDGKVTTKIEKINAWKTNFLKVFEQIIQMLLEAANENYSELKKIQNEWGSILSRLSDDEITRANAIQSVGNLAAFKFNSLTEQTLSALVTIYRRLAAYQVETARALKFLNRAIKQLQPLHRKNQEDIKLATEKNKELQLRIKQDWPPCEIDTTLSEQKWRSILDQQKNLNEARTSLEVLLGNYQNQSNAISYFIGDINEKLGSDKRNSSKITEEVREITHRIDQLPFASNPDFYRRKLEKIKETYKEQRLTQRLNAADQAKDSLRKLFQTDFQSSSGSRNTPYPGNGRSNPFDMLDQDKIYTCTEGKSVLEELIDYINRTPNISFYQKGNVRTVLQELKSEFLEYRLPPESFIEGQFISIKRNSPDALNKIITHLNEGRSSNVKNILKDIAERVRSGNR